MESRTVSAAELALNQQEADGNVTAVSSSAEQQHLQTLELQETKQQHKIHPLCFCGRRGVASILLTPEENEGTDIPIAKWGEFHFWGGG